MKRIIILGFLIALSLAMVISPADAEVKVTNKTQKSSPQEIQILRSTVRSLDYGDFYRDWYDSAIERLFHHMRVDNIVIGRFILSIDDNLKISTPASGTMMTRITIGNPGITVLPYTERNNLAFGLTTLLRKGLSIDASVSFALSGPPDVIFWVVLPTIHF